MRFSMLLMACLASACVTTPSLKTVKLSYGDLSLQSREGRATLRQRVAKAARDYCAEYGAEMTPHASRADPVYCLDMYRSWIIGEMPPKIRHAYFQARREAGVKGRQF